MPSETAKNARTWDIKCCSDGESFSQSVMSLERSISLAVQKDASAFFYILQMLGCWMGKSTKRWGFGRSSGSGACRPSISAILWFDALRCDGRGGSVFLAERVVFAQNSSQSLPLSRMKLVISRKAWYVTVCVGGIRRLERQFEVGVIVDLRLVKVGLVVQEKCAFVVGRCLLAEDGKWGGLLVVCGSWGHNGGSRRKS